jgi:hypothetical protein
LLIRKRLLQHGPVAVVVPHLESTVTGREDKRHAARGEGVSHVIAFIAIQIHIQHGGKGRLIAERTKTAKMAQDAKLGNPRDLAEAGALGRQMQTAAADEFVADLLPLVRAIQNAGATRLKQSAGLSMSEACDRHVAQAGTSQIYSPARGSRSRASLDG